MENQNKLKIGDKVITILDGKKIEGTIKEYRPSTDLTPGIVIIENNGDLLKVIVDNVCKVEESETPKEEVKEKSKINHKESIELTGDQFTDVIASASAKLVQGFDNPISILSASDLMTTVGAKLATEFFEDLDDRQIITFEDYKHKASDIAAQMTIEAMKHGTNLISEFELVLGFITKGIIWK